MPLAVPCRVSVVFSRPLHQPYDYLIPDTDNAANWQPGIRVQVPLGSATAIGLVVQVHHTGSQRTLKPIRKRLDANSLLTRQQQALVNWLAHYYAHPAGPCWFRALPPALRHGQPMPPPPKVWVLTPAGQHIQASELQRAPQQGSCWQQLRQQGQLPVTPAKAAQHRALQALRHKGLVSLQEKETAAITPFAWTAKHQPTLNTEQQQAAEAMCPQPKFTAGLLYGVTGSGKTEVYAHVLQRLHTGQQALLLLPEIGLIEALLPRMQAFFQQPVQVCHSQQAAGERLAVWQQVRAGQAGLVLGTRSALLLPWQRLALVLVDEEHDSAYKEQDGIHMQARDVAVRLAQLHNCPVWLGSATPSLESWHNSQQGRYRLLRLTQRYNQQPLPPIDLIDLRQHQPVEGISPLLREAMREVLAQGRQVLLFLNRRGYAPVMLCDRCRALLECPRCDRLLVWHASDRRLHCHHCAIHQRLPQHCPECGHHHFEPLGQGTERIELAIQQQLPGVPLLRIDRDTTASKQAFRQQFQALHETGPRIILGTQMITKGHDLPHVTLVGILDADSGLLSQDFRAPEQLVQLLQQVAGRAGRGRHPGRVLLQTRHPEHPLLHGIQQQDHATLLPLLMQPRQQIGWPPCRCLARLHVRSRQLARAMDLLHELCQRWMNRPGLSILGPNEDWPLRQGPYYRATLQLLADNRAQRHQALQEWQTLRAALEKKHKASSRVDVDPW